MRVHLQDSQEVGSTAKHYTDAFGNEGPTPAHPASHRVVTAARPNEK